MKALLLIVVLMLFIFLWWFFCHKFISNKILFYKTNISALNVQKKKSLESKLSCDFFNKETEKLNLFFQKTSKNNPDQSFNESVSQIVQALSKNNLCLDFCADKKIIKKNWYCKVPFEFSFNGKFSDILNLFESVSDLFSISEFENFSLKKQKSNIILCNFSLSFLSFTNS